MPDDDITNTLLRVLIQLTARGVFTEESIREVVAPTGKSGKQLRAYNLCDGTRRQAEIAKAIGIDQGNFSRLVTRWVGAGVLFRLGDGAEARLLHLYPISRDAT